MFDPDSIVGSMTVGEHEVTGVPHNDWQEGYVPKINHNSCGGAGHHFGGGAHH